MLTKLSSVTGITGCLFHVIAVVNGCNMYEAMIIGVWMYSNRSDYSSYYNLKYKGDGA